MIAGLIDHAAESGNWIMVDLALAEHFDEPHRSDLARTALPRLDAVGRGQHDFITIDGKTAAHP
jgi:hypothetical protein